MEETAMNSIEWSAPEYTHRERGADWFWTIGLVALAVCGIALWFHNYLFAVFVIVAGASLILFTLRRPHEIHFAIKPDGIYMGRDIYVWRSIKGFNIVRSKSGNPYAKLLILTTKKFLPLYTIPTPDEVSDRVKESLLKAIPSIELGESQSMQFMEKLGF